MKELSVELITPDSRVFTGTAVSVSVPGTAGAFQVLINHMPIISTLEAGKVKIELADKTENIYNITAGVIEVLNNKVTVLAEKVLN